MPKYELTEEHITLENKKLYRIRALIDIPYCNVKAGDLGGFIEDEKNLSQTGQCWVYDNALVYGNAQIWGDAQVYGNAQVCNNARVYGNARVYNNALVGDNAMVRDNAQIYGDARVYGNTLVCGNAMVCDNAYVDGNAMVYGNAQVGYDADISCRSHILTISPIGPKNDVMTFYKDKNGNIMVKCGFLPDNIDEFYNKVKKTYGDSSHAKAYTLAIELAKERILGGTER